MFVHTFGPSVFLQMARMWRKGDTIALLVATQVGAATIEKCYKLSSKQKIEIDCERVKQKLK